jgi:hypothetical protein
MKRLLVLVVAAWAAGGVGCANARYVQKTGDDGVVAVADNSDAWPTYNRTNALKLIQEHVGTDFEILDEGEVVTGQATVNTQNTDRQPTSSRKFPYLTGERETTTATSRTRDLKEYRISYRRKLGPAGFGGPVAPAGGVPPAAGGVPPASATVAPAAMTQSPGLPPDLTGLGVGR